MEGIRQLVGNMTLWNWLTLIAFCIALISGLNAVLNLRSRYRDWWSTNSKAKFQKRIGEFEEHMRKISFFRDKPSNLMLLGLEALLHAFILTLLAFGLCLFGVIFLLALRGLWSIVGLMMFVLAAQMITSTVGRLGVTLDLVSHVNTPNRFVDRVRAFVKEGKAKGFVAQADNTIEDLLMTHGLLP
jgi:hypothetical protein